MQEQPKKRGRPSKSETLSEAETKIDQILTDQQKWSAQASTTSQEQTSSSQALPQLAQIRKFSTQREFMHDLYKFEVASFKKNVAGHAGQPDYVDAEHVHFFHTISSDGKEQTRTSSVGGHFHKVKLTSTGHGQPPNVECFSGPMKEVTKIVNGRAVKVEIPVNDIDHHTHEVEYLRSNVIVERVRNVEAAKAEAALMTRYQSAIPGIQTSDD